MLNNLPFFIDSQQKLGDKKVAIVQSKTNSDITNSLFDGAMYVLKEYQVNIGINDMFLVPGVFEIPYMVTKVIESKKYDAIVCLGCLIRGETDHYDTLRTTVTSKLCDLSCQYMIPIVNLVLTVNNQEQAKARCGLDGKVNLGATYTNGLCRMWIENKDK